MKYRNIIVFLIIAAIFGGLFIRYAYRAPKRHYCDFRVYYKTGERFLAKEDIYARPDESITPFKYSPMFAMLVSPLALLPPKAASLVFFTINFAALLIVFILSRRLIVHDKISFKESIFLYVLSAVFSVRFILHALDSGQVGIIMLALVLMALYFLHKKKDVISAGFMAFSIMFKYASGIFLPYFAMRKKIKFVALVVVFILLYCLLPAVYVGMEKETSYVKSWIPFISRTSFDRASLYDYKNQSLPALVLRYFTADTPYNISVLNLTFNQGIILALAAGLIIYMFIIYPKTNAPLASLDYSLLLLAMVLFNPNAWMHNFVAVIFAYMALFHCLIKTNFKDRFTLFFVLLSFALLTLSSETFIGDNLEGVLEKFSVATIGMLVLMVPLFRLKYKRN
ncbi:MAG: glycosyltransferase family 87 protein [Candidatus Omnitrophota bacterium]